MEMSVSTKAFSSPASHSASLMSPRVDFSEQPYMRFVITRAPHKMDQSATPLPAFPVCPALYHVLFSCYNTCYSPVTSFKTCVISDMRRFGLRQPRLSFVKQWGYDKTKQTSKFISRLNIKRRFRTLKWRARLIEESLVSCQFHFRTNLPASSRDFISLLPK